MASCEGTLGDGTSEGCFYWPGGSPSVKVALASLQSPTPPLATLLRRYSGATQATTREIAKNGFVARAHGRCHTIV